VADYPALLMMVCFRERAAEFSADTLFPNASRSAADFLDACRLLRQRHLLPLLVATRLISLSGWEIEQ
jgi:hypothetical protein